MRALCSDRQNCSQIVSQKFYRIKYFADKPLFYGEFRKSRLKLSSDIASSSRFGPLGKHDRILQKHLYSDFPPFLGNARLFTKFLFTILVPLDPPPPNQQSDGFPLEFLLRGPQTELRTLSQNCEQTLQKLRTNRIMNKRAFLNFLQVFGSFPRSNLAFSSVWPTSSGLRVAAAALPR